MPKRAPLTIALVYGGTSSEREISVRTGNAVAASLKRLGHAVHLFDGKPGFEVDLKRIAPDLAFLAMHGSPGEDGTIQGMLEFLGIPFTGSGQLASALALHKVLAKRLFRQHGIPTPDFIVLDREDYETRDALGLAAVAVEGLGLPLVVKPVLEGSSVGLHIPRTHEELVAALRESFSAGRPFFLEKCVAGDELTVGIVGNPGVPLPVVRIRPHSGVFDYKSKYTKGETDYEVPAALPAPILRETQRVARESFDALRCRDFARVDVMLDSSGQPFVLEVNTIPGMTETSLLPKAASAIGMGYDELVDSMVRLALDRPANFA